MSGAEYSTAFFLQNGESGIPLRLVDRYAEELEKDFMTTALAFESLRERSLKAAGLNFVSNSAHRRLFHE